MINGSLSLKTLTLFFCGYVLDVPPMFRLPSLKKLEFKENVVDGLVTIFYMLERCPNLEILSIEMPDHSLWTGYTLPPKCLVDSLVCLEVTHFDGVDGLAFEFVCYVLLKARRLKEVVVICVSEMDVQLLQPVLDGLPKLGRAVEVRAVIS